ncbi:hypothetical protein [Saccharopolyspora sp. 5N708]|uniref:hypothetical protein n=1 Tax=Saccharopolyspora sp. 5N708 TaxID=3457424 RepID=UPI003FD422FF
MGEQYRVVPEALRRAQQSFEHTAERWNDFAINTLPGWKMSPGDLGLIGRMSGIVDEYNSAVDEITRRVQAGQQTLEQAAGSLHDVALDYEAQDEEYYAKFGWIKRDLDEVAPPPGN